MKLIVEVNRGYYAYTETDEQFAKTEPIRKQRSVRKHEELSVECDLRTYDRSYWVFDLNPDVAHLVLKNADFTEGRGPMLAHRLFTTAGDAHAYIMKQPGIYGTRQDGSNGYAVQEMVVETYEKAIEAEYAKEKEKAMQKLTLRERQILGLE